MLRLVLGICVGLLPVAGFAGCVTQDTLDKGVVFKRADGRSGMVTRADGGIFIDYATGSGYWTDERQTQLGIYETGARMYFSDEETIGGGDRVLTWKFRGKPVVPSAGDSWKTKISEKAVHYNSSEVGHYDTKDKLEAVYAFLPEETVTLSKCEYRVIPVEATFVCSEGGFTRRWLYFADLGFGLETRRGTAENGLLAFKPAG
jgi:hypothetical protein